MSFSQAHPAARAWSSLEPGQPSAVAMAAKERCSTSLAAVEVGTAFPCSPWETDGSSSSTSIPGRAAGSALRSLIKGKASSTSSCFYEKCWLLRAWEYSGTTEEVDGLNLISGYSSAGGGVPASDGNGSCCSQLLDENYLFV